MKWLIQLCGVLHIALSLVSVIIPRLLRWKHHLKDLNPLLREMFWTYAGYILVINMCMGIISLVATAELLNQSRLAASVTLFIALYWLVRIGVQFFYFDRSEAPTGFIYTAGEIALVGLFTLFTIVYGVAFLNNTP